jgi:hypothetical protein
MKDKQIDEKELEDVVSTLEEFAYQKFDDGYEPCQISSGQVIDIVLPILKKQIPAKVVTGLYFLECPKCGNAPDNHDPFCYECGQALDYE